IEHRFFTSKVQDRIKRQIEPSLGVRIRSSTYSIKMFSDSEVARRAPTNSIVLKAVIDLEQKSALTVFAPLYISGDKAGGLRITSAVLPSVEASLNVPPTTIQDPRLKLRAAIDDALADPISVPVTNPFSPGTPMEFTSIYCSARWDMNDIICLFAEINKAKYKHSEIPQIVPRWDLYS